MCAHTMSCGVWKRGRYNVRLNATYLETIFQKTAANAAALRERAPLVRNMVHSASSDEYKWLDDRLRRAEYRKQRHVKWVSEWLMTNKTSYPRGEVNLPLDVRPFHQGGAMWMELPAAARDGDAPQTPHFVVQEAAVSPSIGKEMMPRRNDGAGPSSPNERSSSLPLLATTRSTTFSASEALAILYHRAASSSSSASSNGAKYPQCYALFHDRVGGGGSNRPPSCVTPAMNLIVVSGDSIAFQLFRRLLRLVRDGVATPVTIRVGDKYLPTPQRARPNFYFSKWHDIVLAVHPTHDELHTFQSPMLDDYSKHAPNYVKEEGKSLNRFFIDVAQHRWEKHCGPLHARRQRQNRHGHKKMATTMLPTNIENSDEGDDDEELFYLIFIWDPLTVRPRHDALVTCRPIVVGKETVKFRRLYGPYLQRHTKNDMQSLSPQVPAIPLRALGANIGLHVQGSVQWEQQASRSFEKTLSRMAVSCNEDNDEFHQSSFSSPSSSSALLKQLSANDDSYLYRLSPVLLTPAGSPQLFSNVAMSGETAPTVTSTSSVPSNIAANSQSSAALTSGDGTANVSSIETTWKRTTKVVSKVLRVAEVGRTGSLFRWLRVVERARANRDGSGINNKTMTDSNNITSSSRRQPQQQRGRHRRYFSRVRILDVQKAFVMTNNSSSAFEEDGLHETCKSAWLGVTTTEATVMSNDNNNNNNNNNFSSSGGSHGHRRHNNVSPRFVRRLRYILAPILSLISTEENRNNSTVDTNATSMPSREDQGQEQQKRRPTVSYFSPAFRGLDGCGDFATLLTLTALLADIVQDGVREGGRAFE
ncbi:Hypothetical protein, putative [Bodo saltans]|uniref:Uncharacterized protein n=1 Tax=Bodo saltans TaxID=75058 RepID=A0A0S4JE46_BODSA|nr:Hypothetical protein, putative [Bodo saltans]|eukprot:CUG88563.1 Hypothetical protein, putative [Bodo saltans]